MNFPFEQVETNLVTRSVSSNQKGKMEFKVKVSKSITFSDTTNIDEIRQFLYPNRISVTTNYLQNGNLIASKGISSLNELSSCGYSQTNISVPCSSKNSNYLDENQTTISNQHDSINSIYDSLLAQSCSVLTEESVISSTTPEPNPQKSPTISISSSNSEISEVESDDESNSSTVYHTKRRKSCPISESSTKKKSLTRLSKVKYIMSTYYYENESYTEFRRLRKDFQNQISSTSHEPISPLDRRLMSNIDKPTVTFKPVSFGFESNDSSIRNIWQGSIEFQQVTYNTQMFPLLDIVQNSQLNICSQLSTMDELDCKDLTKDKVFSYIREIRQTSDKYRILLVRFVEQENHDNSGHDSLFYYFIKHNIYGMIDNLTKGDKIKNIFLMPLLAGEKISDKLQNDLKLIKNPYKENVLLGVIIYRHHLVDVLESPMSPQFHEFIHVLDKTPLSIPLYPD